MQMDCPCFLVCYLVDRSDQRTRWWQDAVDAARAQGVVVLYAGDHYPAAAQGYHWLDGSGNRY
jgi:hypothetical protein